jgi:hypothetical protein
LERAVADLDPRDEARAFPAIRFLAAREDAEWYRDLYVGYFLGGALPRAVDATDFRLLVRDVSTAWARGDYDRAGRVLDALERLPELEGVKSGDRVLVGYLKVQVLLAQGRSEDAASIATRLRREVGASVPGVVGSREILSSIASALGVHRLGVRKIGRNELVKVTYKSGQVRHAKFKKVEADIRSGACTLSEEQ